VSMEREPSMGGMNSGREVSSANRRKSLRGFILMIQSEDVISR